MFVFFLFFKVAKCSKEHNNPFLKCAFFLSFNFSFIYLAAAQLLEKLFIYLFIFYFLLFYYFVAPGCARLPDVKKWNKVLLK